MAIERGGGSQDLEKYILSLVKNTKFPSSRDATSQRLIPGGTRLLPSGQRLIPPRAGTPLTGGGPAPVPSTSSTLSDLLGFDPSKVDFSNASAPIDPDEADESISKMKTNQLDAQVDRQANTVEQLTGEKPERTSPSTLERIFDVLMRGQYASAEGMDKAMDLVREDVKEGGIGAAFDIGKLPERLGAFGRGAVEGITGREKANFHEVLQENTGTKNVGTGIAGFLLDVFADPTTYITLGTGAAAKAGAKGAAKGIGKKSIARKGVGNAIIDQAAEGAAIKAAREVAADPKTIKAAEEATRNFQNKLVQEAASKGQKLKPPKKKELDSIAQAFIREEMDSAALKAQKQFIGENQRAFQLRLAGKNVVPKELGKKIYNRAYKATDPIRQLPTVQAFKTFMSPKHNLGVLHEPYRRNMGMGVAEFDNRVNQFRASVRGLSKSDAEEIALQREAGTFLPGEKGEIQSAFGEAMDEMYEIELQHGLHKGGPTIAESDYLENYVPHYYKNSETKINDFEKMVKGQLNKNIDAQEARRIQSIEYAKEMGMDPITDIREIFLRRAADHHRKISTVNFLNEAASEYGIKLNKMGKKNRQAILKQFEEMGTPLEKVTFKNFDYADEVYVPSHIKGILQDMDETVTSSTAAREILSKLDKFQGAIKTGFTVLVPGHHIRNAIGDMFLNLEDGVVNPARYKHAAQITAGRDAKAGSSLRSALDNTKVKIGNTQQSLWDIHKLYERVGLRSGFYDTEIQRNLAKSGTRVVNRARNLSTAREDTARLAHFIDAMKKEMPTNVKQGQKLIELEKAARRAGERVAKYNFDYGDLTKFEQNYMRRTFLFYTFLRKNLPLQVEMLALNPGKVALAPKINSAVSQILGAPEDIEMEHTIPQWIREMAAPVVGGTERNPVYSTIQLPTADLGRLNPDAKSVANQILTLLRPELKGIAELGTGTQGFSGAPVDGAFDYSTSQLPFSSIIKKMLDPERESGEKKTDILNLLTGLGLQGATEQRRRGEIRRQQDPIQKLVSENRRDIRKDLFRELK